MAVGFAQVGTFVTGATSVTLPLAAVPTTLRIAVAAVDSGHPTAGIIPTCITKGWAFVGSFEGGGGVYGADAGPRRITLFVRKLQADGTDEAPTFTIPAGTESRVGGVIVNLTHSAGQDVIRYAASFGADTSSGTAFSAVGAPAIAFSGFTGDLAALFYVVATDAATWSAEAVAATGITFGTITERLESQSTIGADASRAIATGAITAGGPDAQPPTISATLSSASTGVAAMMLFQDFNPDSGPGTITATFDGALSRVRLENVDLDQNATTVDIERSTDQIQWTPVRGGAAAPIVQLPEVVDTFSRTVADGWGTCDTGQTATLTGGLATEYDVGSGVGTLALVDTSGRHVTYNGASLRNVELFATATFPQTATGGPYENDIVCRRVDASNYYYLAAVADTTGNIDINIVKQVATVFTTLATISNSETYSPGDTIGMRLEVAGYRLRGKVWNETTGSEPSDWMLEAVDMSLDAAGGVGIRSDRNSANTNVGLIPAWDNFTASAIGAKVDDYEFVPGVVNYYRVTAHDDGLVPTDIETTSLTPTLTQTWLKSVPRPFLNRTVALLGNTFTYDRAERAGVFPVVGRSLPVAVTDVRGSRQYTLKVRTDTAQAAADLELLLAGGDILFLHTPAGATAPSGVFLAAGRVQIERPAPPSLLRFTHIAVTEVAAPGPDVVGATASWQTVINGYASWTTYMAAELTWADGLELIGDPDEVIVP